MKGRTPLNFVRFLDYAANDLNFLQKVGGGYIFIHRMLLEYFAALPIDGAADSCESLAHVSQAPAELATPINSGGS